jgi:hypothetical protein
MERLIEFLVNYLLKKQILKLSSIEKSFFLYKKLDKKIKLNQEIITINYSSESPYLKEESVVSSIIDGTNLYLWFTKSGNGRYLPESYIIFRRLLKEYQDVICIVEGKTNKVIVIKDNNLIASFSKFNISTRDERLIKSQYQVENIVILTEKEYTKYLNESLKFLRITDLLDILNIKIDTKELLSKSVYFLALPLLISSIVITLLLAGYSFYLNGKKEILHEVFKENQFSNKEVKNDIQKNEKENLMYKDLSQEFQYVDKSTALSNILKITDEMNMTIYYIKIYEKNVDFIVKTKNSILISAYIKKLFQTNQFEDVKNLNTRKMKESIVEVTMSAKLKELL